MYVECLLVLNAMQNGQSENVSSRTRDDWMYLECLFMLLNAINIVVSSFGSIVHGDLFLPNWDSMSRDACVPKIKVRQRTK